MQGLHLIADLHGCTCPATRLTNAAALRTRCVELCRQHGLQVVGELFHAFAGTTEAQNGVTGTVVLAESHLAIHTWPEAGGVTLDLYVCNFSRDHSADARALLATLIADFSPQQVCRQEVLRGRPGASPASAA